MLCDMIVHFFQHSTVLVTESFVVHTVETPQRRREHKDDSTVADYMRRYQSGTSLEASISNASEAHS